MFPNNEREFPSGFPRRRTTYFLSVGVKTGLDAAHENLDLQMKASCAILSASKSEFVESNYGYDFILT